MKYNMRTCLLSQSSQASGPTPEKILIEITRRPAHSVRAYIRFVREAPTKKQPLTTRAAKPSSIKSRCYKDGDPATTNPPSKIPGRIASPIREQEKGGDAGKKGNRDKTNKSDPTVKVAPCAFEFEAGLHVKHSS
jgi:hypothetical protein